MFYISGGYPQHPMINNVLFYTNDPYRNCPPPYVLIGMQCLFFSQPYAPWNMGETWEESYANYFDAADTCRLNTQRKKDTRVNISPRYNIQGEGDLASEVANYEEALKYCNNMSLSRGCSPSLLYKDGKCQQWSPLDGHVVEIPCDWKTKMRFICEFKRH